MRNKNKILQITLIFALALALNSCLSPVKTEAVSSYTINKIPNHITTHRPRHISLLILAPTTLSIYNTTQMAYSTEPYKIAYFAKNQWAATPTSMLQALLVQTLSRSNFFHTVVSSPTNIYADYWLNTQIIELNQDYHTTPAKLKLKIAVQLNQALTNKIIASKEFSITTTLPIASPYGGAIATNQAMALILENINSFCISSLAKRN